MNFQHLDRWKITAAKAYVSGAEVLCPGGKGHGLTRLRWNVAGKCEAPIYREHLGADGRPPSDFFCGTVHGLGRLEKRTRGPVHILEMSVRCRKCGECLKARATHWRKRAEQELRATKGRTWFVTLTLTPQAQFEAVSRARLRLAGQGTRFDSLTREQQFAERVREIAPEVTRWLKRVRKESGAKLRYLLVVEEHKGGGAADGLPHLHALVHESDPMAPVRARTLQKQWRLGFSQAVLVAKDGDLRSASYVTKYLTKSASARVRASLGYGLAPQPNTPSRPSFSKKSVTTPLPDPPSDNPTGSKEWGLHNVSNIASCERTRCSPPQAGRQAFETAAAAPASAPPEPAALASSVDAAAARSPQRSAAVASFYGSRGSAPPPQAPPSALSVELGRRMAKFANRRVDPPVRTRRKTGPDYH